MQKRTKKIIAANWKLYKHPEQAREFIIGLKNEAFKIPRFFDEHEVLIFPQAFSLEAVSSLCAGTEIGFGPQNVYCLGSGAFTGENSAALAKQLSCQFSLVGHSERRSLFHENDDLLQKKNLLLQSLEMTPVFCVGETAEQRQAQQTLSVCFSQLDIGLKGLDLHRRLIVAYEPVWAIGTGKVASLQQVGEVHAALHEKLAGCGFTDFQILYGGSVKPDNSAELIRLPFVDGFLAGGASLELSSFLAIRKI